MKAHLLVGERQDTGEPVYWMTVGIDVPFDLALEDFERQLSGHVPDGTTVRVPTTMLSFDTDHRSRA